MFCSAPITGRAARARALIDAGGEREARGAAGARSRVAAERRGRVGSADSRAVERAGGERQRRGTLRAWRPSSSRAHRSWPEYALLFSLLCYC